MAKINVKEIREHVVHMNGGWAKGAAATEFSGISQTDFTSEIQAAAVSEQEMADLLARVDIKRAEIEDRYAKLKANGVRVAHGVRGDKNFGPDSALYGAMGFVRDSERASGLTRKSKETPAAK